MGCQENHNWEQQLKCRMVCRGHTDKALGPQLAAPGQACWLLVPSVAPACHGSIPEIPTPACAQWLDAGCESVLGVTLGRLDCRQAPHTCAAMCSCFSVLADSVTREGRGQVDGPAGTAVRRDLPSAQRGKAMVGDLALSPQELPERDQPVQHGIAHQGWHLISP